MSSFRKSSLSIADRRAAGLSGDLADLVRTFKQLFSAYRPELHYMRGPGPAWRAKHQPARTDGISLSLPDLVRVKAR
jgi:hypothetical protein